MWKSLLTLDEVLRGEATQAERLRDGQLDVPAGGLTALVLVLGAFYGFCMGWFALFNHDAPGVAQVVASMVKVPALFLLTLLVTLPSLYVFNALVGSRLQPPAILRLLTASLAVTLAVLASFGPIVAFFSVTTTSYPFIVLLNVAVFTVAALLGLRFLRQTMQRLALALVEVTTETAAPAVFGPLDHVPGSPLGPNVRTVFACWLAAFGLVGAQMSWVLRPFIGHPGTPFQWFRPRESNFFEAVARAVISLFS
jgi:hypothetical protein